MTDLQIFEIVAACVSAYGLMGGLTYHLYDTYTEVTGDSLSASAIFWPLSLSLFLGLKVGRAVDLMFDAIKTRRARKAFKRDLENRAQIAALMLKEAETKKLVAEIERELLTDKK